MTRFINKKFIPSVLGAYLMGVKEKTEREKLSSEMKKLARDSDARFWRDIARRIEKSKDSLVEVNVGKISRYSSNGETIVVPGIVLGSGRIEEPVNVAALYFSKSAETKIKEAGGKTLSFRELMKENSKGKDIKILG